MEKLLILLLFVVLLVSLVACGKDKPVPARPTSSPSEAPASDVPKESTPEPFLAGGFTVNTRVPENVLSGEAREAFDKALESYDGASLFPVALLGKQTVAGANYAILCQSQAVAPNAAAGLKVVVVGRDLQGNSSLLAVNDFRLTDYVRREDSAAAAPVPGGWTVNTEFPAPEADERLSEACAAVMNETVTPVALLGTQVVAGLNYAVLCCSHAETGAALKVVTIYAALNGTFEELSSVTLDLSALAAW